MRLLVYVDDKDLEFIEGTRKVGGTVRMCSRGEEREATILGVAEPLSLMGSGDRYKAFYSIVLLGAMLTV